MNRTVEPELLDTDAGTPQEVADSLADLRAINRRFGGVSTMRDLVRRVARRCRDVACYVSPMADSKPGRPADNASASFPRIVGDALALPFHDASFDLVGCSLFLHHLELGEIRRFVAEALRVCRIAVVLNDLRRSALHLALVSAAMPFTRSRITRHDGPMSIRRSYTMSEMRELLAASGAAQIELNPHYLYRMGAILWKRSLGQG